MTLSTITLHEEEVDIWEGTFTPDEIGVYGYKFIAGDGDAVKYYCEDGNEGKAGTVGDKNRLFFQLTVYDKGYKNIKWYIIGYGEDEILYKELIKKYNLEQNFILLGKKINPYPYMKKCDLYVQPSRYEGKAVTVGEARILGRPVLITNYPTAKSQLNNGFDGYITDMSVDGIVKGIEKLYNDNELRFRLEKNCMDTDYSNGHELKKLYEIIK